MAKFEVLEEINALFNEGLHRQNRGTLPRGYVYHLGHPGKTLLLTGMPDLPIQLKADRLAEKAGEGYGHPFQLADVRDLPEAINNPLAVFSYGDKAKAMNIITKIEKYEKQFLAGVSLNPEVNGIWLNINSIRTVFPKDAHEWLRWIEEDKTLYLDKKEVLSILANPRHPEDVANNPTLLNKINSFQNPI